MNHYDMNAPFLENFFNAVKGAALKLFAVIFLYITRMVRKLVTATLQLLMHTNLNLMAMQRPLQLKD